MAHPFRCNGCMTPTFRGTIVVAKFVNLGLYIQNMLFAKQVKKFMSTTSSIKLQVLHQAE